MSFLNTIVSPSLFPICAAKALGTICCLVDLTMNVPLPGLLDSREEGENRNVTCNLIIWILIKGIYLQMIGGLMMN